MKNVTKRARAEVKKDNYFVSDKEGISFLHSGCTMLDCILGGGYALGRITNIVGDKSTAKTALATEALTNFTMQYPDGAAAYREAESAFDRNYAAAMGLPIDKIDFGDEQLATVEAFARDFDNFLTQQIKAKQPGIYVLDSLDALSDEAEMERDFDKGTYAMDKAKMLGKFFRTRTQKQEKAQVLLIIISQVRDNINAMFGDKHRRSGGKALDFYASQVLYLAHIKTLKRVINKVERPTGFTVRAKVKKNKVGLPLREADFDFIFAYGLEDLGASIQWLKQVGHLEDADMSEADAKTYLKNLETLEGNDYRKEQLAISAVVKRAWAAVESSFLPKRAKYK